MTRKRHKKRKSIFRVGYLLPLVGILICFVVESMFQASTLELGLTDLAFLFYLIFCIIKLEISSAADAKRYNKTKEKAAKADLETQPKRILRIQASTRLGKIPASKPKKRG